MKIFNWLFQPYPLSGSWGNYVKIALKGGVFVTLFLFIFRPFGMRVPPEAFYFFVLTCLAYGLATTVSLLFLGLLIRFFPRTFEEDKWVVWKEIVTNMAAVMLIGTSNMVLAKFMFNNSISWAIFWDWQVTTFTIGIFPILFTAFYKQQVLKKRYQEQAGQLTDKIEASALAEDTKQDKIDLVGDNNNDLLSLLPKQIRFLQAADNYVKVFYVDQDRLQSALLRSTLKKMEQQLEEYPEFFRCHRTYIVNLKFVQHVSGNAQGYKLTVADTTDLIPVSRSLNAEIDQKLSISSEN